MELGAVMKNEIVRPLVTLVVPGATAMGPYFVQAHRHVPELASYLEAHKTVGVLVATLSVLAAGLVVENIGSWVEANVIDDWIGKRYNGLTTDWYNYLRLAFETEPIGQRYLRSVTLRLKFELAMTPALVGSIAGLNWLNSDLNIFSRTQIWAVSIAMGGFAAFFLYEAWKSAILLAKTRYVLLTPNDTSLPKELEPL